HTTILFTCTPTPAPYTLSLHDALPISDMREVDGPYDKLVSIGVLEHAGKHGLDEVIRTHGEFLKPGGLGVIQFVGHVGRHQTDPDRKSTRLNSSHQIISYAVFFFKKKK